MLYAHTKTDSCGSLAPEAEWQTLKTHLDNVAAMAARFAESFGAAPFAHLQGQLHDLGKASKEFQQRLHGKKRKVDHAAAGARALLKAWQNKTDEPLDPRGIWLAMMLGYGITGHHSGLPDCGSPTETSTLQWRLSETYHSIPDYETELPLVTVPPLTDCLDLFRLSLTPQSIAFSLSFFTRMLFSCLTDADWLDTEQFCDPDRSLARSPVWPTVPELADRLERTLRERGFLQTTPLETKSALHSSLPHPQRIDAARKLILTSCQKAAAQKPGVFSLTVPTGGGKTLSSLAFALEHARLHHLCRIILVVPYTSIIEQNADVFRDILGADAVLEHHCNYIHPAEGRTEKDPATGNSKDDDQDDAAEALRFRLATENWDATLIVTTAVQFFESLFACQSSRCRKLHNIARSVVILDEAQMTPVNLLAPSVAALQELAKNYGTSLVLCTATQPALEKSKDFPLGFTPEQVREIIPQDLLPPLFNVFRRTSVELLGKLDDEQLARRLAEETSALCIVNTRRHARTVFEALRVQKGNQGSLFHLSARMTPAHRSAVLQTIRARLAENLPCLVVSTSLVECGVDISFPAVFREQAGLDSVAQSAGRCNRGGELAMGRVYVFTPACGLPKNAHDLQRRATLFQNVATRFADLFCPEAVHDFFAQLRGYAQTDETNILDRIYSDNRALFQKRSNPDIPRFAFREISRDYRFIPTDNMESVIVENDLPGNTEATDLVHRLEARDADRTVYRLLQRHTVQVYRHELHAFLAAGSVEQVLDHFYILRGGAGYRADIGLDVDDPLSMAPSDSIF